METVITHHPSLAPTPLHRGHSADYNDEVKAVLKETGYLCAVNCESGFNHVFSDPFEIRRGKPWHKEIELFRMAFFLQRHGLN